MPFPPLAGGYLFVVPCLFFPKEFTIFCILGVHLLFRA